RGVEDDLPATSPERSAPTMALLYEGVPAERWAGDLSATDAATRYGGLVALAALGAAAAEHLEAAAARRAAPGPAVRWAAAEAGARIPGATEAHGAAVVRLLDDPSPGVRRAAGRAAGRMPSTATALVPRLRAESPADRRVAKAALLALGA